MTVRDRLTDAGQAFTRSEVKVVRELLTNYPVGGLTTVAGLAKRARVSDPTVVRLAHKLGFDGFADLQRNLLAEVEAHLSSPLTILAEQRQDGAEDDHLQRLLHGVANATRVTADGIVPGQFQAAADLLMDPRRRILCLGGRFSRHLAGVLRWHLQQLRPGVELLAGPEFELADYLVDVGKRDVLIVYDFRRYQPDVVHFALQAQAAGCKAILITDRWRSPIAAVADIVFSVPVESSSPFDTMVPALALTEALIAAATALRADGIGERLQAVERARTRYRAAICRAPEAE